MKQETMVRYDEAKYNFHEGDTKLHIDKFLFYTNITLECLSIKEKEFREMFDEVIIHSEAYDVEGVVLEGYKAVYISDTEKSRLAIEKLEIKKFVKDSVEIKLVNMCKYSNIEELVYKYISSKYERLEVVMFEEEYIKNKDIIMNVTFPIETIYKDGHKVLEDLATFITRNIKNLEVNRIIIVPYKKEDNER